MAMALLLARFYALWMGVMSTSAHAEQDQSLAVNSSRDSTLASAAGDTFAILLAMVWLAQGLKMTLSTAAQTSVVLGTTERLFALIERRPQRADTAHVGRHIPKDAVVNTLELRKVSFRYSAGRPWVFQNASATLHQGTLNFFLGNSGAGKSTLEHLLCGELQPTKGKACANAT
jgi:ABC-type bacteriocin/lantibiotic exporter with double-glycine peptidase domain